MIQCHPCQEIDAEMPNISADKIAPAAKRKAVPTTASTNKRARKPTSVCPDHNTGNPRSYCLRCQIEGKGGGALCIGGHGKRKYNCKECHPDKHEANLETSRKQYAKKRNAGNINCVDHNSGRPKTICFECQINGTGGGGLCDGRHGKRKHDCSECHPDKHAKLLFNQRERYKSTWKSNRIMHDSTGTLPSSSNLNDGIIKYSDGSYVDESKCVCGKELDSRTDPICNDCATYLTNIFK